LDSANRLKNQWIVFGGLGIFAVFLLITLQRSKVTEKREKKQQEKFSQDLMESQEDERTRIARELHDSVGQKLTLIKKKSQKLDQFEITTLTNNALDEVRTISKGLYPTLLKELGLTDSIRQLVDEYDKQTDLFFTMDLEDVDDYFTDNTTLNFYRLIQECLTNIVKHAKAKAVTVSIKKEEKTIITCISDNGKGFDVGTGKKKNSLGLKTIFERIRIMNGKLSIDSKMTVGTTFIFTIPIQNES
jgi:signal transduction histidine kinase